MKKSYANLQGPQAAQTTRRLSPVFRDGNQIRVLLLSYFLDDGKNNEKRKTNDRVILCETLDSVGNEI